ncbi:hypothetical protein J0910_03655 [Nocardiopsis sp. CNT-189]|uniref:hypothetical protein n=1 Tax=Nocardiopsis oceanisediminis TaxID=2816862 RepID=UPI003B34D99C
METTTTSPAALLAADFPSWYVFRDLLDGPGHWRAVRQDPARAVSAPTLAGLRGRLAAVEGAER